MLQQCAVRVAHAERVWMRWTLMTVTRELPGDLGASIYLHKCYYILYTHNYVDAGQQVVTCPKRQVGVEHGRRCP